MTLSFYYTAPAYRLPTSSTTPVANESVDVFQVTHPFHPLSGQRFDLVDRYRTWGEDRVFYYDTEGRLKSLPAAYTDIDPPDPFIAQSAGRAYFHPADLWVAVQLAEELER